MHSSTHTHFTLQLGRGNYGLKLGSRFEISTRGGDFLLRCGRREFFWERGMGWTVEAAK